MGVWLKQSRKRAANAATTAVARVFVEVRLFIDHGVAVVVLVVADLRLGNATGVILDRFGVGRITAAAVSSGCFQ